MYSARLWQSLMKESTLTSAGISACVPQHVVQLVLLLAEEPHQRPVLGQQGLCGPPRADPPEAIAQAILRILISEALEWIDQA